MALPCTESIKKGELSLSLKFLLLAAKAANPADDLPDGAAASAAVGITVEEIHLADLLVRFVSRGQGDCNRFVIIFQAVNPGSVSNNEKERPFGLSLSNARNLP